MEFSKFDNHRNVKYLNWLRSQPCLISGQEAQCTHHIRLGTNGGTGIKPSDYFCIPLKNEYHTTGSEALHIIGEDTFFKKFNVDIEQLFTLYLKRYLVEELNFDIILLDIDHKSLAALIIEVIEEKRVVKPKVSLTKSKLKKKGLKEDKYYQSAKEMKRIKDKELRTIKKEQATLNKTKTFKGNEYYEKAKELNRQRDKELRDKNKEKLSNYRKEQYKKLKEYNSQRS